MLEQYHELHVEEPIAVVFGALAVAAAVGRWDSLIDAADRNLLPRGGCQYSSRTKERVCRGRVLECLRPVSLILQETLYQSASRVRLRLRWRVEPIEAGTLLRCDLKAALNGAAVMKRRRWEQELHNECEHLLRSVSQYLQARRSDQGAAPGAMGHSTGNKSIVATKITSVSGKPIFR